MDTHLSKLYASEIKFKKIVYNASLIALILVVLGVIALVSLNTHKRVKEMGVRKILGASILNIILLFIKEFMLIIGVASLVAVPLSYYFIKRWLNNYAYQIDISIHPFLIVVTGLVGVTFLLIAALTFKAATTNPSKSLRTE
jgi:ABC-type antimicrobial peptide transport system permease subunit